MAEGGAGRPRRSGNACQRHGRLFPRSAGAPQVARPHRGSHRRMRLLRQHQPVEGRLRRPWLEKVNRAKSLKPKA